MPVVSYDHVMILGCVLAALICFLIQRMIKCSLEPKQYGYLRDLLLAAAWLLLAIWFASRQSRFVVGISLLAGVLGLAESIWPRNIWRVGYFVLGLFCAWYGPSISFISFVDGEYIYLTPLESMVVTSLWFTVFPLILQQLDVISGLVGHVLAVTFVLMLTSVVLAANGMQDAFFMSFTGLMLLGVFWSRFSSFYRQAGKAMSSMWGALVAGTAVLGVSKGIVFSSMLFLSLGLFAIPLTEASLNLASLVLVDMSHGTERFYRHLIRSGWEHHNAVRLITCMCAALGALSAFSQYFGRLWLGVAILIVLLAAVPLFLRRRKQSPINNAKPNLWGVAIDNVSMNYALAKTRGMILSSGGAKLVATVNALGMVEAVHDDEYHTILHDAALVLSDGVGLLWGLRFLGMPIQERVTGIDFAEQLCRMAAAEGWPVYFLGAKGDTARRCAEKLESCYPGLVVAGTHDGYFSMDDPSIAEAIRASGAKVLFAAMGIPRQEKWVARNADRLGSVVAVGVGGAFDVLSGQLDRAPALMQKIGLEWFFRLCQEPSRWKKDLQLMSFVLRVFATRLGFYQAGGNS